MCEKVTFELQTRESYKASDLPKGSHQAAVEAPSVDFPSLPRASTEMQTLNQDTQWFNLLPSCP